MKVKGVGGAEPVKKSQDIKLPKAMPAKTTKPADVKPEVDRLLGRPITSEELTKSLEVMDLYQKIRRGDETIDPLVQTLKNLSDPNFDAVIIASCVCGAWLGALLTEKDRLNDMSRKHQGRLKMLEEHVRATTTVTAATETTGKLVDRKA